MLLTVVPVAAGLIGFWLFFKSIDWFEKNLSTLSLTNGTSKINFYDERTIYSINSRIRLSRLRFTKTRKILRP